MVSVSALNFPKVPCRRRLPDYPHARPLVIHRDVIQVYLICHACSWINSTLKYHRRLSVWRCVNFFVSHFPHSVFVPRASPSLICEQTTHMKISDLNCLIWQPSSSAHTSQGSSQNSRTMHCMSPIDLLDLNLQCLSFCCCSLRWHAEAAELELAFLSSSLQHSIEPNDVDSFA